MKKITEATNKRVGKQVFMAGLFLVVLIGGWHYPLLGFFIPLCMILGIGIGIFRGRKWCDWLCPRGSFYDTLIKPISPKNNIPPFFKSISFRLAMLSLLMIIMISQLIKRWPDINKIGFMFVIMLTATTALGIILALIFHQRTWCCFCPIGTIANLLGRGKYVLEIDSKLCKECKLCHKTCPIQISPFNFKKDNIKNVTDWDCLKCGQCIAVCPNKALGFHLGQKGKS